MSGALAVLSSTHGGGVVVASPSFNGGQVALNSNGTADGTFYTGNSNWFSPSLSGVGALYWARTTRTSGSPGTNFNPASGVWYSLAAGQAWSNSGAGACNGTIEIASDAAGSNIVTTGSISVNNAL